MIGLPDPAGVVEAAAETGELVSLPGGDPSAVNLVVAGNPAPAAVTRTDVGYVGPGAGDLGRLAAAVAVSGEFSRLHYPEPDFTVAGPWLVVEPLNGVASTVHAGTGRADLIVEHAAELVGALDQLRGRIGAVLEAARPEHDSYPVRADEEGVFTRGMTTFALDAINTEGAAATISFEVSSTPATTADSVESRFECLDGVTGATFTESVGVERSTPSAGLRAAVEQAHLAVIGDCGYEWYPEPTVFSYIPGGDKVALGTGTPAATTFTDAEYEDCVGLLSRCVEEVSE